jgi:hypothetical protein
MLLVSMIFISIHLIVPICLSHGVLSTDEATAIVTGAPQEINLLQKKSLEGPAQFRVISYHDHKEANTG